MIRGIDVSDANGHPYWHGVVNDNVEFVIIKSTQGRTFVNPEASESIAGCRIVGLPFALYHFVDFGVKGVIQAEFLINQSMQWGINPKSIRYALDLEVDPSSPDTLTNAGPTGVQTIVQDMSHAILQTTGHLPLLYGNPSFFNEYLGDGYGGHPLWIAEYGPDTPHIPEGWTDYTIWQTNDSAAITGIQGAVDINLFNGDSEAMKQFFLV